MLSSHADHAPLITPFAHHGLLSISFLSQHFFFSLSPLGFCFHYSPTLQGAPNLLKYIKMWMCKCNRSLTRLILLIYLYILIIIIFFFLMLIIIILYSAKKQNEIIIIIIMAVAITFSHRLATSSNISWYSNIGTTYIWVYIHLFFFLWIIDKPNSPSKKKNW